MYASYKIFLFYSQATDLDIDVLLYSIQQNAASAKFAINQSTGWIRTNGVFLDTIGAIYEFQVAVKDNGGKANFSEDTTSVRVSFQIIPVNKFHFAKNLTLRVENVISSWNLLGLFLRKFILKMPNNAKLLSKGQRIMPIQLGPVYYNYFIVNY